MSEKKDKTAFKKFLDKNVEIKNGKEIIYLEDLVKFAAGEEKYFQDIETKLIDASYSTVMGAVMRNDASLVEGCKKTWKIIKNKGVEE